jgi:hypothetical protein
MLLTDVYHKQNGVVSKPFAFIPKNLNLQMCSEDRYVQEVEGTLYVNPFLKKWNKADFR